MSDNEIRKTLIRCGLEAGFEKVEIIDSQTALYLHATFYSQYIPVNGDTIWVIFNGYCHIWQKLNNKAKYIRSMEGDYQKLNSFLSDAENTEDKTKEALIPNPTFIKNDILRDRYSTLRKEEEVPLPPCDNLMITFNIDINGIFTINVEEISPESFPCVDEFLGVLNGTQNAKNDEQSQVSPDSDKGFRIPKRIFTNDENINAVGIDLGTTRCCVAVNRKNGIETALLDNQGQRLLPSYISYDEEHVKCGQIVIDRLRNYANSSVFDTKRIIGRKFENLKIDESWTFEILNDDGGILIQTEDHNKSMLKKKPEEVSAELLELVKQKVEEFQGKKQNETVITVPAAFEETQKLSTIAAANLAGWGKVRLLPEPVAAAFAYFVDRSVPENSKILLFDLGGGTLDVCIFKISKGELSFISQSGDSNLGGRDFDNLLVNYFKEKLKDSGIILTKSKQYKLMQKCQEAKEALSVTNEYLLDAEDFGGTEDIKITKQEFETLSFDILEKLQENIYMSLEKAKCTKKDMNKVLYVGGGCRMPKVKELLEEIFPHAEHCCEVNPDEVVAIGAAYYAYYLNFNPITKCENMRYIHYKVESNNTTNCCNFPKKAPTFNDKIKVVGIDFGARKCGAAINRKDGIQILRLDDTGERFLPSYVAFEEEMEKCGQIVVDRLKTLAKTTIFDSQKFLGKQLDEISLDDEWPFELCTFKNKLKIQVQSPNGILLKYPEEVCAVLLKHILQKAKHYQGNHLNDAVITIPLTFNEKQKDALRASALLAGWKQIDLLEEPFAATFSYFNERPIPTNEMLFLFDLGHNSLKVYILEIHNNQIKIIGNCEDFNCGGKAFDNVLMNYFATELDKKHNIKLSQNKLYKFSNAVQKIKHNLTKLTKASLDVEDFDYLIENSYIEIKREDFQKMAQKLLDKIQACIISVLEKTELNVNNIDKVLYAGGGCRMPRVKTLLYQIFPNSEQCCNENPEDVFAIGAAYYAYHLQATPEDESRCSII
uniref:Heat shock protein 70 n=1 Tax=Panagrolaimus davidi TaxID=227884 RepID=A0A914P1J8_9BILA